MKIKPLILFLIILLSSMAGCVGDIREQSVEKNDDLIVTNFDEDVREEAESNITQEDCERRGGIWTEAPDRGEEYYCDFDEDVREEAESNITQEDCERRGGIWTEAPDRGEEYYCDFDEDVREEADEDTNNWFFWSMNGTNEAIMGITNDSLNWSHLIIDFTNSSGNYISPSQYHVADHPNYEKNLTMNLSWWEDGWYTANITVYSYDESTDTSSIIQQAYWRFWLGHHCNQPDAVGCED